LTRIRTLTVFFALLAVATALGACGGGSSDPQTVIDEATLQGVESADLQMTLGIDAKGEEGGHVDVSLSGPFQTVSEAELPELDLALTAKGKMGSEKIDFEGGFTLLGDRAFVGYEGSEYEVDPSTFTFVRALVKRRTGAEGKAGEVTACQEAVAGVNVSDFLDNLSDGGSADVGGTSTTKVSGDLSVGGAVGAAIELSEDPACSEQLRATGSFPSTAQLERAQGQVEKAIESAHVDVYVGDDHIVRRLAAQMTVEPQAGSASGPDSAVLDFDLTLEGVNEEQTISAPQNAKPLSALFVKLGINPLELLSLLENGKGGFSSPESIEELLEGIRSGSFQ
jgi:hypothetical protein